MSPRSIKLASDQPVVRILEPRNRSESGQSVELQSQTDAYLARYYARRAPEMEEAFGWACRSADIAHLQEELPRMVEGLDVLEIACGTGYWTQFMARRARSVTATDINDEMLALARSKEYPAGRVRHVRQNAWRLSRLAGQGAFNAAVALFWWSHVPHARARAFLRELKRTLPPGSQVILVDNLPADCRRTPPVGVDPDGNSYQRRLLHSGEAFDIIKNYPSRQDLLGVIDGLGVDARYTAFDCLWLLSFRTPPED